MKVSRPALATLVVAGTLSAVVVPAITAPAATTSSTRTEVAVSTTSPITSVAESKVSVRIPLPATAGAHPAACDWLSYLRYRDVKGPRAAAQADKILIAQPGILEGAGAFDSVARDTVAAAAKAGRHIEFWALDRRSNCLEDGTGRQAALAARNPQLAIDYYYHGASVNGRTFAGFLPNDQLGWLAQQGIAQTVQDQFDLMTAELPSASLRRQKVLCGGHSLGGIITGYFAEWDFNGTPGFQQCSGYFALDSAIAISLGSLSGMATMTNQNPGQSYDQLQTALNLGLAPRSLQLPALINAETMNLLGIAGVAADVNPTGQSTLAASLPPNNTNLDLTQRALFSQDLTTFLTGMPAVRDFRLTNAATLGGLMDNNSQPLAFLQTSVGFFAGGTVAAKNFPAPNNVAQIPGLQGIAPLLGPDPKAIPNQPMGPLYTWQNYNQVTANDFTNPAKEVSDIAELARSLAEQPLDFTEEYFPTKLATDVNSSTAPQIAGHLKFPNGIAANPVLNLLGGSGLVVASGNLPAGRTVIAPGYHHLDVLTAAPVQNNGGPDLISTNLAAFAEGA
ncbi:MAG TPA: hypothetical protein VJT31_00855 [Rugosimonospora sp.]|nr:hypothetical protein [Rugosimonospora sp.]